MKICIVSDSHDRAQHLSAAVADAKAQGAEAVIHCGDIIGGNTLRASLKLGLPMHVVHGNNLGDPVAIGRLACNSDELLHYHGHDAGISLGGRRIFITHYPHLGRGMACTGDYDVVCCGHSHEALITQEPNILGGKTWLVNPGTVAGIAGAPATWILGDLDALSFELCRTPT
jgi:hypothetical protein